MRKSQLRRSILCILRVIAVISCLSLSALAQTPSPTPSPAPTTPAGSSMPQFFDILIGRTGALIPMLQNELEGPLLPWLENLSWWLAVLVIIFGFARLWRENSGAGADLFWWFGRIAIIFTLRGAAQPSSVNWMRSARRSPGAEAETAIAYYTGYTTITVIVLKKTTAGSPKDISPSSLPARS